MRAAFSEGTGLPSRTTYRRCYRKASTTKSDGMGAIALNLPVCVAYSPPLQAVLVLVTPLRSDPRGLATNQLPDSAGIGLATGEDKGLRRRGWPCGEAAA